MVLNIVGYAGPPYVNLHVEIIYSFNCLHTLEMIFWRDQYAPRITSTLGLTQYSHSISKNLPLPNLLYTFRRFRKICNRSA